MKTCLLFVCLLLLTLTLHAQPECCTKLSADGQALYEAGEYALAIKKFELAKSACNCTGMDSWIARCNEKLRPGSAQPPAPAATFINYRHELAGDMVAIKGGTYDMGCTSEQQDCESDETPVTRMTVGNFYMGKYEVTFDQYDRFCDATGRTKPSDEGWGRGARPVIYVSWHDAVAFCNWLSERSGLQKVYTINGTDVTANWQAKGYRLPTEAEWEYAARGGGKAVLFGNGKNTLDPREVNFDASAAYKMPYSVVGEYRAKAVPVGSLNSPNALGLHDMSGNVLEWCWDWFGDYAGGQRTDYRGPYSGSFRVLRGGSWSDYPQRCRVAHRNINSPDYRYNAGIGFRLARTP